VISQLREFFGCIIEGKCERNLIGCWSDGQLPNMQNPKVMSFFQITKNKVACAGERVLFINAKCGVASIPK
jgi:hypothetical protein